MYSIIVLYTTIDINPALTQINLIFYSLCFDLNLKLSVPVICGGTSRKKKQVSESQSPDNFQLTVPSPGIFSLGPEKLINNSPFPGLYQVR